MFRDNRGEKWGSIKLPSAYIYIYTYMCVLGVHSRSLERETSTGVLANFSRKSANLKRNASNFERKIAEILSEHKPLLSQL